MVLYRCRVVQSGANWLKLAKTVTQVYLIVWYFNAFHIRCLRSSMVVFWSWNLEVPGSNPVKVNFFSVFSFSGQVRVQTPLEFTWFFPTWNLIIFTIYEFLALLLTYNKQKNRWEIWSYLEWILTPVRSISCYYVLKGLIVDCPVIKYGKIICRKNWNGAKIDSWRGHVVEPCPDFQQNQWISSPKHWTHLIQR